MKKRLVALPLLAAMMVALTILPAFAQYITGPRGGCYYINRNGNKTYVDRSFCSNTAKRSTGRYIRGPRGGCYYINRNGNKTYVARSLCNR
jgi:hypothetical protein